MAREVIAPESAFVVPGFFSAVECRTWRNRGQQAGYEANAPVSLAQGATRLDEVRNNGRAIADRPDWAQALWQSMAHFFPPIDGGLPVGLNERFRFYLYDPGQYFKPQLDGRYERSPTEYSLWTLMIYLNGGFEGGETDLFAHDHVVTPTEGRLLAFRHRQAHAGREVLRGRKHVLRTDVMYRFPAKGDPRFHPDR